MKRVAETQGRKETGFDQEMSSNDAPKRATAAQLANRKIKAARERKTRVGSPNLGLSQPSANPFGSIDPNVVPTSSFSTGASNGFNFGQSQSFSQPSAATGASNKGPSLSTSFGGEQNSSSGSFKLFGSQTTSAPPSFDFSSSSNNQQINNPFSNMSSNQGSGFQGFKGNMFSIPGASQAEKKPESQPNGGGGFFGQASTSTSTPMFGAAPTTTAPFFSMSAGPNMFGQTNSAAPNMFGAAPITSPTKGSEAMQMSPDGPKSSGQGIFNVSAPAPPIFKSPFSTPATGFNLGASTAATSASTPAWSFKPAASTPASASTSGSILFGASKPDEPKAAATATATTGAGAGAGTGTSTLFGAPTSSTPLFGQLAKPADTTQTNTTQGTPSTATSKPAGIFGANASFSAAPAGGSLFSHLSQPKNATSTSTASETPSLFGHLAQPKPEAVSSPAKETTPLFSAPSTSKPLFGAPATTAQTTQPAFSLFGQATKPAEKPAESPKPATATATSGSQTPSIFATPPTGGSLFQRATEPAKEEQAQQPAPPTQTENKAPGEPSPLFVSTNTPALAQPKPMFNSFMNSTSSNAAKPFSPAFGAAPAVPQAAPAKAADVPAPPKPQYADASTETIFEVETPLRDFRPEEEEYPPNATEEVRELFLRAWRLSALNASFQEEIATVNCWSQDLDPIIAHYVMLRKMIGHPHPLVSVYTPIPPGSKLPWTPQPPFSEYDEQDKRKRAQLTAQSDKATSPVKEALMPNGDSTVSGPSATSHKRKASDVEGEEADSPDKTGKRTKVIEDKAANSSDETDETNEPSPSKTLSLFASSFVAQKSCGSSADSNEAPSSDESVSDEDEATDADQAEDKTTTPSVSPPGSSNGGGGRSLFDRIERDGNGQPVRQVQPEESLEEAKSLVNDGNDISSSVLGGSRTGSPFNIPGSLTPLTGSTNGMGSTRSPSPLDPTKAKETKSSSLFANLPPSGSVLFGANTSFTSTSTNGGAMSAPTSNLFGAPPSSASSPGNSGSAPATSNIFSAPSPTSTPPPTSNIFGAPSSTSAPAPSNMFATPSSTSTSTATNNSSLMPPTSNIFAGLKPNSFTQSGSGSMLAPFPLSGVTSVDPSRATTPAQSDTDNTNEPSDEVEKHAQVDFTRSGPGEEDEDAVFECRARGYQLTDGNWKVKGVGILRILKHRTNNKSRILLRADPSGSIILNNHLMPEIEYKQNGNNVQFLVASESGFHQWMLRVKTDESAVNLKDSMEKHKKRD
ncbi:nucleoporin nsp1 [Arthroderma uncinatum]|uniref:nucleoporin nsp1 n=1 Tax=Arthroderma uncinatum TaxID=74035 RepID=UPI00144AD73C|nr:nucleoporin nsp1 [Arthroderma uncinatum]KAF3490601.1 nucleoporin nsp1 [Arthroderma uncinatum]